MKDRGRLIHTAAAGIMAALFCWPAFAADINTGALSENGWYSDDTRADGTGSEAAGTNLVSDTLTDDPEATATGSATHDGDIDGQILFGFPPLTPPVGENQGAVNLTIAAGANPGKSQVSHRKDDGTGHAPGSSFGPGFAATYSWMGDGTGSVTASLKFGIKTSEFGGLGSSSRTGENAWDKVLIYEPGNLNGGTSDGTWQMETISYTSGLWWFFDRAAGAATIGTPLTLEDMSTSGVTVGGGPKTIADVYALITAPGAHITSVQFGIGSFNAGGNVYVNQLETNFYRSGDTTTFGPTPGTVTLEADDTCYNAGETTVTIDITLANAPIDVVGGQFFMDYDDTRLTLVSVDPGDFPFTEEIFEDVSTLGEITYASGVLPPVPGVTDGVMARITFTATLDACSISDLVTFRPGTVPPTRVSDDQANEVPAEFIDLGEITIDLTDPVITCPPNIIVECDESTAPSNTGTATATDNCGSAPAPAVWINEFHYDNSGGDTGEFVEVAGTAGLDLTDYSVALYNGSNGTLYNTIDLSGTLDDEGCGIGALAFLQSGIQNGAPDGLALVTPGGVVIEFLCYEGSFTAVDGPAVGITCTDIGVSEPGGTPIGESLQLTGSGSQSADFTWDGPFAESPGDLNSGQTISPCGGGGGGPMITFDDDVVAGVCPQESTITRTWTATDACGNTDTCDQVITVDDSMPPTFTCPSDVMVNADAGLCSADVNPGVPTDVMDNCDPMPMVEGVRSDGMLLTDPYPATGFGGPVTITWTVTDACMNEDDCMQTITVDAVNELVVAVELAPTIDTGTSPDTLDRCITFELYDCGPDTFEVVEEVLTFDVETGMPTVANQTILIPCGEYDCITARDRLHTLRRTDDDGDFMIVGTQYVCDFTSTGTTDDSLIGGNLNDDEYVDVLDFGGYAGEFAMNYGTGDTTCATAAIHADISGDGLVNEDDFTFIQVNFLTFREPNCCGLGPLPATNTGMSGRFGLRNPVQSGPVMRISVRELRRRGLHSYVAGDVNNDGWLDVQDVQDFIGGVMP